MDGRGWCFTSSGVASGVVPLSRPMCPSRASMLWDRVSLIAPGSLVALSSSITLKTMSHTRNATAPLAIASRSFGALLDCSTRSSPGRVSESHFSIEAAVLGGAPRRSCNSPPRARGSAVTSIFAKTLCVNSGSTRLPMVRIKLAWSINAGLSAMIAASAVATVRWSPVEATQSSANFSMSTLGLERSESRVCSFSGICAKAVVVFSNSAAARTGLASPNIMWNADFIVRSCG